MRKPPIVYRQKIARGLKDNVLVRRGPHNPPPGPFTRVVRNHDGGFFSNFNKVVACLCHWPRDRLHVDWTLRGEEFRYYEPSWPPGANAWEKLFAQPSGVVGRGVDVKMFPDPRYTHKFAADMYRGAGVASRAAMHAAWSRLRPRPELRAAIAAAATDLRAARPSGQLVGVHVRSAGIAPEQPSRVLPTPDDMADAAALVLKFDGAVVLATDSADVVGLFRDRFGPSVYVRDAARVPSYADVRGLHETAPPSLALATEVYLDAIVLAQCDYLVSAVSNVATAAWYMAPHVPHAFVEVR